MQWIYPIHFGLWGGMTTRVLYVPLGLAPLVGFVTGFWWWRLRRRAEERARSAARSRPRLALRFQAFVPRPDQKALPA